MQKNAQPVEMVGFVQAIKNFFLKYVDFSGTATRAEYWWVVLAKLGCGVLLLLFWGLNVLLFGEELGTIFSAVIFIPAVLVLIIPSISLFVRRIHDAGFTAWLYYAPLLAWGLIAFMAGLTDELGPTYIARAFGVLDRLGDLFTYALGITFAVLPSKLQNNPYRK